MSKQYIQPQEVSEGEELLQIELNRRDLFPLTQIGFSFQYQWKDVFGCKVDFLFNKKRFDTQQDLVVELRGPDHQKERREERDELIKAALERRGKKVFWINYDGTPSKAKARLWADLIVAELEKLKK